MTRAEPLGAPAPLPRLPGWRGRLVAFLASCERRPLAYGEHDCALFPAGAVLAMTGVDPAAPWRGRYGTLREGLRVLRAAGAADHVELAARLHPEVDPATAQVGDLAALGEGLDGVPVLGVVVGARIAALAPEGLGSVPLLVEEEGRVRRSALRAFRP